MAFFREEKAPREPFLNAPASVLGLIGIILAAHAARILLPEAQSDAVLQDYALVPARYVASAWAAQGEPPVSLWDATVPLVSHLFLHVDWVHAGVNAIGILIAGPPVARRLGGLGFVLLFLVCGLAAAATFLVVNWSAYVGAIGASGAMSGMMGAAIRIFYGDRAGMVHANDRTAPLASLRGMPVIFFSAMWVVTNVLAGVTGLGAGTGHIEVVAWEAHLGGYFAGLFLIGPFEAMSRKRGVAAA